MIGENTMNNQVIVIGTGRLAKEFALSLIDLGYNINCFVDNKPILPSNVLRNVSVQKMEILSEIELGNIDIYIAKKKMFITPILHYLNELNIKSVYVVDNDFLYKDECIERRESTHELMQKVVLGDSPILGYLETNIIDQCNLRCAGCTHFSGIASERRNIENVLSDIEALKEYTILNFRLLGGEPLLLQELDKVVETARTILGDSCKLEIVTNGLLIPKLSEKIINAIRQHDVKINISLYEPTKALLDKIIYVLEANNIRYCINDEGMKDRSVIKKFHTCLTCTKDNNGRISSSLCYNQGCAFLRDKKIYRCAYPGLIKYANEEFNLDLVVSPDDYIDCGTTLTWNDIYKITQPVPFCNYCSERKKEFTWNTQDTTNYLLYFYK